MTRAVAKQRVWDLPTRLFHWLLVALIAFSWWSAENGEIDWHILSGIAILTLLVFRILWGIFGGSTARFASFVRGPRSVLTYLRDPGRWRSAGHTPLGALSVLALLALTTVQVGLGLFAVDEDGLNEGPLAGLVSIDTADAAREIHEIFFNLLLALIVLHVAAILFYRLFKGRRLVGPMITGKAELDPQAEPMRPAKTGAAFACLAVAVAFSSWILAGAPPFGG